MRLQVSIIVPTYNPGDYIFECLYSIIRQSLSQSNFELIIVVNGCNEPYKTKIKEFLLLNKCFNYKIYQIDEAGVSNARNLGLDMSLGENILFLDDDDVLSLNYLDNLLKKVSKDSIVVSNVLCFSNKNKIITPDYLTKSFFYVKDNDSIFKKRKFLSTSCCKLIPREIISDRRFSVRFKIGEDALFMFALSDRIVNIVKSAEDAIYYRRIRIGSATRHSQLFSHRWQNMCNLVIAYFTIYFSSPSRYKFTFFLSRVVAVLRNLLK